jgi:hypothetical protein
MKYESDRSLANKYKKQLKDTVEAWSFKDDDFASIITALSEVTAEVGIAFIGHKTTCELLSRLALTVDVAGYGAEK